MNRTVQRRATAPVATNPIAAPARTTNAPRFVTVILDWRPTWFLARLALVGAYLLGGIVKLTDWPPQPSRSRRILA
ncbi:hypothetical protein TomTYG45_00110 [Sphingobium sp. TomTYG45]